MKVSLNIPYKKFTPEEIDKGCFDVSMDVKTFKADILQKESYYHKTITKLLEVAKCQDVHLECDYLPHDQRCWVCQIRTQEEP